MRYIKYLYLMILMATSLPANAQVGSAKTVTALNAEVPANIATNTSNQITPALLNQVLLDIIASYANLKGDPSGSVNFLMTNSAGNAIVVSGVSHLAGASSVPTVQTCAGATLSTGSSDLAGQVGFNSSTSCSLKFGTAYGSPPFCEVEAAGATAAAILVTASTTILTAQFSVAQTSLYYHCLGQ